MRTGSPKRRHRVKAKPRASRQGLALVEVLVAIMILSTSTVFVLQALSRAAVLEREISNLGRSQTFAANKMAELEALARAGIKIKPKQKGSFISQEQAFNWQLLIRPYEGDAALLQMTLDVLWKQGEESYKRRVEGLIPQPPVEEIS